MPDHITGERLTRLFRPRSVALVGASDKSAFSQIAYHNLVQFGFAEHTYLVSRRGTPTHGQPTVISCAQIGEPVDVAYLMVPQAGLLEALDDAAAAGIRNACVLSAGYAEAGEAGRAAQAELARHAAGLGMVLLGPNHLGFANLTDGVPVCSVPGLPRVPGPVALLSQSGASSSAMTDFAAMANVGLSYLVTLGNEAMITAGHVLDYLVDDPGTRAVAIFMETVRDPETFRRAARRAAEAGKAIVVLKAGSSAADEDAVRAAYQAVIAAAPDGARIEGVLVSPMRRGGAELLVGVVPDPQWGPVLAVAIGGLFVEVLRDSALAPLPVTPGQAGRLLDRLRGRAVLDGVRGAAPADRDALTAVIARIGDLALALGDSLESLEVDPLLIDGDRIEALDAVVTWRENG